MLYDAILNGARSIAFYGGNNPNCWTASDSAARLELELLELGAEAASGRDQLAEPTGAGTRESGHDPDAAGERCDDPGDQPARQFRRSLGDRSSPRRGHGTRDDRRDSPQRFPRAPSTPRDGRSPSPTARSQTTSRSGACTSTTSFPTHRRRRPQRRPRRPPAEGRRALTSSPPGRVLPGASRSATVSTSRSPWRTRAASRRVSSQRCRRRRTSRSRGRRRIAARAALPAPRSSATSTSSVRPARFGSRPR